MRESFVAYHSRPQKERVGEGEDLISIKQLGQINKAMYDTLGESALYLMHPLPVDAETFEEIASDMRNHPKNVTKLQSSNGLYVRIALLALSLGKMNGNLHNNNVRNGRAHLEKRDVVIKTNKKELSNPRSGYIENQGLVFDHIPDGMGRRLAGILGLDAENIPKVFSTSMPTRDGRVAKKDMIKIHTAYQLSEEQYEAVALIAPEATISVVENGIVTKKMQLALGNWIENRVKCGNQNCVTNIKKEGVKPKHNIKNVGEEKVLTCNYCEHTDTLGKVYKENRFLYIGE